LSFNPSLKYQQNFNGGENMRIIRLALRSTAIDNFLAYPSARAMVNPDFVNALILLQDLGVRHPTNPADVDNAITSRGLHPTFKNYLSALYELIVTPPPHRSYDVLRPMESILRYIGVTLSLPPLTLSKSDLISYLTVVESYGGAHGYNMTKEKQQPMFEKLYGRFQRDVSSAAGSSNPSLATAVSSNNALLRPDVLYAIPNTGKPTSQAMEVAKDLINSVMRENWNPANFDRVVEKNYQKIKETILYRSGSSSIDAKKDIEKRRREEEMRRTDPSLLVPGATRTDISLEEAVPLSVSAQQWTDPYTLSFLLAFFSNYYKQIYSLPDR